MHRQNKPSFGIINAGLQTAQTNQRRVHMSTNDSTDSPHSRWRCQYHIVFAPKYRRKAIYGKIKTDIGIMMLSIPPKYSVASIMGYIKGKSSLMIYEKYANMKYKYGNRHFWCRGYYVDTVGKNKTAIAEYIRNQLHEDQQCEH